jgi:hypothetical protein
VLINSLFSNSCRYLQSSGLIGEIDPSFGQLTLLQHLYVLHSIVSEFFYFLTINISLHCLREKIIALVLTQIFCFYFPITKLKDNRLIPRRLWKALSRRAYLCCVLSHQLLLRTTKLYNVHDVSFVLSNNNLEMLFLSFVVLGLLVTF